MLRHICFIASVFVGFAGSLLAQVSLTGTVLDPSGAAVSGAEIVLAGEDARSQSAPTDYSGAFRFDGVTPGELSRERSP